MRNADRRDVQHRTEVQREARSALMVTAGRINEQHVRWLPDSSDYRLQQGSLTESEQARLVWSAGAALHDDGLTTGAHRRPSGISSAARPAATPDEADEDRADPRAGREPPRHGAERGQAHLLPDQLLAGARPLAHALILAPWTRSAQLP